MKRLLALNVFILIIVLCNITSAEMQTKQGTILYKGWTKSLQSYQAGGSDYFVLYEDADIKDNDGNKIKNSQKTETILKPSDKVPLSELKKFVDKFVEIKGESIEGEAVDFPKDDLSQKPMDIFLDETGESRLQSPKTKVVGAGFKVYKIRKIKNASAK